MEKQVASYKCPCCDAPLNFSASSGKMKCDYCDSELDIETVREYNDTTGEKEENGGTIPSYSEMPESESVWDEEGVGLYSCPFCGARLVTDATTAADKCPYCGNNTVFEDRLKGAFKPDLVIPFKITKEQAEEALRNFYKGKVLLPKSFRDENRIKEIKGVYVPFWLYDCDTDANFAYDATRSTVWSDKKYIYTKTDHYFVERRARLHFDKVPADGSSKADDAYMEAIEPFHYSDLIPFDKIYLSGFLADQYDIDSSKMKPRIEDRTAGSADAFLRGTLQGYDSVVQRRGQINYKNTTVKYGLFPVWMLNTTYKGETYRFAMNGQTGKLVGNMPCDKGRYWAAFGITAAIVMLLGTLLGGLL